MRRRAHLLLNVLLSAPVAMAAAAAPVQAAQPANPPQPYIIVIDPGHGGAYDPNNPDQSWDPGAIGINGLQEKDVTLAVAKDLQQQLRQDDVNAVLTRETDRDMSIADREAVAEALHANLFISIHFNAFTDAGANGSLVLYPNDNSQKFASVMAQTLDTRLKPYGIPNGGPQLRDNWWVHATMPTVTTEAAFITNPQEGALLAQPGFQMFLAQSMRAGAEAYDPTILSRRSAIEAWNRAHPEQVLVPGQPSGSTVAAAAPTAAQGGRGIPWRTVGLVLLATVVVCSIRWPRRSWLLSAATVRLLRRLWRRSVVGRAAARRRRRAVRARSMAARSQRFARSARYDELLVTGRVVRRARASRGDAVSTHSRS